MKLKRGIDILTIIVKTPYQDLGDEWVRLHKDRMGQRWYDLSALPQIIQTSGRIVRSKEGCPLYWVLWVPLKLSC